MSPRGLLPKLVLLPLVGFVVACGGGSGASDQQLKNAEDRGAQNQKIQDAQNAQRQEQARLRREIEQLKRSKGGTTTSVAPPSSGGTAPVTPPATTSSGSSCGGGLSVGPNTTCSFAAVVRSAYLVNGGGSGTVQAYSPVTQRFYSMSCSGGAPTVCRGGNSAVVYIR